MTHALLTIGAAALIAAAIVFHGLSTRFEIVRMDDAHVFKIDRLTGQLSICGVWTTENRARADCKPFDE
jgi:hypothetical protein